MLIILKIKRSKMTWMALFVPDRESVMYLKGFRVSTKVHSQIPDLSFTRNMVLIKFINLSKPLVSLPITCRSGSSSCFCHSRSVTVIY